MSVFLCILIQNDLFQTDQQDQLYACAVMVTDKIIVAANSFDHFGMPLRWDKKT